MKRFLVAGVLVLAVSAKAQNSPLSGLADRGVPVSTDVLPIQPAGAARLEKVTIANLISILPGSATLVNNIFTGTQTFKAGTGSSDNNLSNGGSGYCPLVADGPGTPTADAAPGTQGSGGGHQSGLVFNGSTLEFVVSNETAAFLNRSFTWTDCGQADSINIARADEGWDATHNGGTDDDGNSLSGLIGNYRFQGNSADGTFLTYGAIGGVTDSSVAHTLHGDSTNGSAVIANLDQDPRSIVTVGAQLRVKQSGVAGVVFPVGTTVLSETATSITASATATRTVTAANVFAQEQYAHWRVQAFIFGKLTTIVDYGWLNDLTDTGVRLRDGSSLYAGSSSPKRIIDGATKGVSFAQVTFTQLPTCNSATKGEMFTVTNASAAPAYLGTVSAGGGTALVPVMCDGAGSWLGV